MKQSHRSTGVGATAFAVAAFLAIAGSASGSIIDLLGPAGDYAILGEPGATIHLSSGPLRVYGNVGVGDNAQLNFDGGGQIGGRVDFAPTATLNTGNSIITGGTQQVNFSPISQAIQNVVNYANSLTPTQSFSSITNAVTLNSTGAVNVISISGDIHLSGGNLTLNGSASDRFIFKIQGGFELSGNTNIVLTGGLTASNVLWDFTGSQGHAQTSGKSDTAGIFLAPLLPIQINGGTQNGEFISGVGISGQSNPIFIQPTPSTPPSVPETNTLLPLLLVLGAAIGGPYVRRALA